MIPFPRHILPAPGPAHPRPLFAVLPALLGLAALLALGGCASSLPGVHDPKTASVALPHPEETALGQQFATASAAHPGLSALRLIPIGVDGFLLRAQLIARAEKTLDLQYFIFSSDETGQLLADALIRAADRGVRVRLLLDDFDNTGHDAEIEALDAHPNIEVRLYNPLAYRGDIKLLRWSELLLHQPRLDYRMHNKLLVVDNAVAMVGGRNVGDDYFQIDPAGQLGDYEVVAAGPIVAHLSKCFDKFWNTPSSVPVAALASGPVQPQALANYRQQLTLHRRQERADGTDYATRMRSGEPLASVLDGRLPLVWARVSLWYDFPEKKLVENGALPGELMHRAIFQAAAASHTEVLVISPFVVPGDDGMALFDDLHRRAVPARLLTNSMESSTDATQAFAGYTHYRRALLADNVQLYEIRADPGIIRGTGQSAQMSSYGNFGLHTKLYIFDREKLFIGSMNFDERSFHLNTEMGLMIESPELARQAAQLFEGLVQPANSYQVLFVPSSAMNFRGIHNPPRLAWRTLESGHPVEYHFDPAANEWQRLKINLLAFLPLDSEL